MKVGDFVSRKPFLNELVMILLLFVGMMFNIFLSAFGIYGTFIDTIYTAYYILVSTLILISILRTRKRIIRENVNNVIRITNTISLIAIVTLLVSYIMSIVISRTLYEAKSVYFLVLGILMLLQVLGMQVIFFCSIISMSKVKTPIRIDTKSN